MVHFVTDVQIVRRKLCLCTCCKYSICKAKYIITIFGFIFKL